LLGCSVARLLGCSYLLSLLALELTQPDVEMLLVLVTEELETLVVEVLARALAGAGVELVVT